MNKTETLELYKKYLTTKIKIVDDNGDEKEFLPVRSKLANKFIDFDKSLNNDNPSELLKFAKSDKFKGRLLFWSDQHFYHNNIIKYCNRPYEDSYYMNLQLAQNYKDTVNENDIVVWAGDTAFGKVDRAREFLLSQKLPGKKLLILGNHDFENGSFEYRDMKLFDEISSCESFTYNLEINGEIKENNFIISHYPISEELLPKNTYNIHGHIHDQQKGLPWINLGVEIVNYKPVLLQEAFDIAKNYKADKTKKVTIYGASI